MPAENAAVEAMNEMLMRLDDPGVAEIMKPGDPTTIGAWFARVGGYDSIGFCSAAEDWVTERLKPKTDNAYPPAVPSHKKYGLWRGKKWVRRNPKGDT